MSTLLTSPNIPRLIKEVGGRFSSQLGIELMKMDAESLNKWWLCSILFGARIGEQIAINTYKEFEHNNVVSPQVIVNTGWDGLVEILDRGGYVRYDFKTATKLLEVMSTLLKEYQGDLNTLHKVARDAAELEQRLKQLGKGIGDVTVNIFLRELRGIWEKANPAIQPLTLLGARNLGLYRSGDPLQALKLVWNEQNIKEFEFADFEVALLRIGKNYCKRKKCKYCPVKWGCNYVKE
jgi:endonuclease III